MIPVQNDNVKVQGSLDGHKIAMQIDEGALAHIMSIMTDLYSDEELACIREYSTNALDAQIQAGVTRPIEVTTPSALTPYFKVKDYGVGLSANDIEDVYSKYGASTKRGSNDVVGMLGLGCKSALTYTNQFNVISVKNGVKTHVSVSRVADGTGVMEVVDTRATNEPNGTEVVIPVKFGSQFEKKAKQFFRFWKPGTVLLDGVEPKGIEGTKVGDNMVVLRDDTTDYIVMGNVAYPCERRLYEGQYWRDFGIVAYVNIGDVAFTPSREALQYNAHTNATIARLKTEFQANVTKAIVDDISTAPSPAEALKRYLAWPEYLLRATNVVTYKGQSIPQYFTGDFTVFFPHRGRYAATSEGRIDHRGLKGAVLVTGFDLTNLSPRHRQKIKIWQEENETSYTSFICMKNLPAGGWLDDMPQIDFEDIKSIKIETSKTAVARTIRNKYDVYQANGTLLNTDTFATNKKVYYVSPTDNFAKERMGLLTAQAPDAIIVLLNKNRWDKFNRDFPGAQHVTVLVKETVDSLVKKVTLADKIVMKAPYGDNRIARLLANESIDDPEVADYVATLTDARKSGSSATYDAVRNVANLAFIAPPTLDYSDVPTSPFRKYPLLTGFDSSANAAHASLYINAVYAANNKEN